MAATAKSFPIASVALSRADAWLLYRLAYFPNIKREPRENALDSQGVTPAGQRIGRYLLGKDVPDLTDAEKLIAKRYQTAAKHRSGAR